MVMHRFYLLSPTSITHLYKDFRRCLSDSDPGVMDTCLVVLYDLVKVCVCACACVTICVILYRACNVSICYNCAAIRIHFCFEIPPTCYNCIALIN